MSNLINGQANIRAAILAMHPASKDACQLLLNQMPDIRNIHMNHAFMMKEMVKCMIATGINHGLEKKQVEQLIKKEGAMVIVIAGSVHELQFQQHGGDWGKRAAAVGVGILIGALFG